MKSKKEQIIQMYFIENLKPVEISKKLNISKSAVTQVLQKDERYENEKSKRKQENKLKHIEKTKEIIKTKRRKTQVKNNIDILVLKSMHNQDSMELSKRKRLNNITYRNWNTSAYNYNEKRKRFEFKKELGRSNDVPKYIKVEV